MAIDLKEFRKKMETGEISTASSLHMRNEDIQQKQRAPQYDYVKKETGKMCKLLIPKEIAIPFNPMTGEEEPEGFNRSNKFRPMASATSVALLVKSYANENESVKAKFLSVVGEEEWDTSDVNTLTEKDKVIFAPYLEISIFTIPVFNVRLKALSSQAWGKNYILDIKRDKDTGKIIGEIPYPVRANRFYAAVANEEVNDYQEKCKNGEIKENDEQQADKVRSIRQARIRVGSDYPMNYIRCFEVPLDETCNIKEVWAQDGVSSVKILPYLKVAKESAGLKDSLTKLRTGGWKTRDIYFDFYELDMTCPTDTTDPKEIGKKTTFDKAEVSIKDLANKDKVLAAIRDCIDEEGDVERKVLSSARTSKYDEDVERKLMMAIGAEFKLDSEWLTESVIKANEEFIIETFGEKGEELCMQADAGLAPETHIKDGADASAEGQNFDIDAIMNASESEDVDLDKMDLGLEEVNLDQ